MSTETTAVPRVGIAWVPRSAEEAIEVARAVEEGGLWGYGIPDSPYLYHDLYPVMSACLAATETTRVGPFVTNPVSRHWTVHAASMRTYDALHPGRGFLGIAAGDGAVHSVGLAPATRAEFAAAIGEIAERYDGERPYEILAAASGMRTAAAVGPVADGLVVGTGLEPAATEAIAGAAREARAAAGVQAPLEAWTMALVHLVEREEDVPETRRHYRGMAMSYARFALDFGFAGKHVPEEMQEPLRAGLARYTHQAHAVLGAENPNARIFDDRPEIMEYLVDRFCVIGTAEQVAARLRGLRGVTGVWLAMLADRPSAVVRELAEALG